MKPLKLLNVEDSPIDAAVLLNHLSQAGFEVHSKMVKTADEMKTALAEQVWDIVISEYQMSDFSGLEAFDVLKNSEQDIPFIIISGIIGEETAVQTMIAGVSDYLMKDNLTRLASAVKRELQEAANRKSHLHLKKKLDESEKRLKFALSSTGIGTWDLNLKNNTVDCSNECYEIIKTPNFSGNLKDFKTLLHPEDAHTVWNEVRKAIDNQTIFSIEFRIFTSQDEILWLSQRGVPEYDADGKPFRITGIIIDITERKHLEQNLRASEARFRALSENTIAGVALCDENGKLLYVNDAYLKIIGYTRQDFEQDKLNWRELTAPEFDGLDRTAIAQARANKFSEQYEKEYIRRDGSRVPVLLGIAFSEIDGGEHFVSAILDITKRKEAEKELRESEENFRALTEATTHIVWTIVGNEGNKVFLDWWKNLTGQTDAEMKGMGWTNVLHPDDKESVTNEWLTAIENKSVFNTVYRIRTVSGEYRFYAIRGVPVFDANGEFRRWIGAISDITVRKRGEEKIWQSERRFRSLINSTSQIVWTANAKGILQTAHTPDGNFFPVNSEDLMREWILRLHPEDKHTAIEEFRQAMREKSKFKSEYRLRHLDGIFYHFVSRGTPVFEKDGTICEWVGTLTDITESKIAEEKLRKSEEQLRQAQRLESVGRLAGGIAHDFNNMLTAINGYSDLTLRRLSSDDPLRRNVEEIKKAGERSAALTQQLLAFSRRQMMQPKILDINSIISETLVMLERLIGEDIKLAAELTSDIGLIKADPGQISQVITNLVVNSRDAMPDGGTITIKTENVCLNQEQITRYEWAKTGEFVLFQISDTGVGIDDETLQHIFEPFYTTKELGKGTGLGLATVYGIVKQSGGYIWVTSEVGKGTNFEVYLPQVSEKNGIPEEENAAKLLVPEGNELILLVEDEEKVRDLTRQLLEFCGYTVIEAKNGIQALEICGQQGKEINLLLTDVIMPQMGGRELAKKITEKFSHIKILFTSGYTDDSIIKYEVVDAHTNFIQKPFTLETLAQKVRKVLDGGIEIS